MKKILLIFILLTGCAKVSTDKVNENETINITNNYYQQTVCTVSNGTVIHNEYLQISMFVEDGRLRFIDDLFNSDFYLDEYENVRYIANNFDCAGQQYFLVVGDNSIYGFFLDWRDENTEFTKEYFHSMVKELNTLGSNMTIAYDGDVKNLFSCDDTTITTTCGNPQFYVEKSDGNTYLIDFKNNKIEQQRKDVVPFTDFYYLDNDLYLMSMNDLEVKLAKVVDGKEVYANYSFESKEGNSIKAEYLFVSLDDSVIHLIEADGSYYTVNIGDLDFDTKVNLEKNSNTVRNVDVKLNQGNLVESFTLHYTDNTSEEFNIENIYLFYR